MPGRYSSSVCAVIYGLGLVVRYARRAIALNRNGLDASECLPLWAYEALEKCYRLMHFEVDIGTLPEAPTAGKPVVVFMNHPTTPALPGVMAALLERFPGYRIVPVITTKHDRNVLGKGVAAIGGIAIDRNDSTAAIRSLQDGVKRFEGQPVLFLLFADGSRPLQKRIDASRVHYVRMGCPEIAAALRYTAGPRPIGLLTLAGCLPDASYYDATNAFTVWGTELWKLPRLYGARLVIRFERVLLPPLTRRAMREWLLKRWILKNQLIKEWLQRESSSF